MLIPYGKQHITESDIESVVEVLKSKFLTKQILSNPTYQFSKTALLYNFTNTLLEI